MFPELVARTFETFLGFIPVSFAARASLLGVVAITVAGGAHEYRNLVAQNNTATAVEQVAVQLNGVSEKLDDVKKVQAETRAEANQRMDKIEAKVDDLLKERRLHSK